MMPAPPATRRDPSLLTRVAIAMVVIIFLVFGVHTFYSFLAQKADLVERIQQDTDESLQRLSKNIAPFIEAYSINEYEKLVATEAALKHHLAVLVQDAKTGKIVGKPYYVSGRVRGQSGEYVPYREDDPKLAKRVGNAFYADSAPIISDTGQVLGKVSVYASDDILVEKLKGLLLKDLGTSLILALVLALLLITALRRYCVHSLKYMEAAMKYRDSEGVPLQPLPGFRYRELNALSDTINTMLATIKDSRERRALESARLKNVINGTRAGTWEWNILTGETVFNELWADIIGYTLDELAPLSIETWTQFVHPGDLDRSNECLRRHFIGELPYYECEVRMRHKDGHWVWVLDRGKVTSRTEDGQPLMMYGTHKDISERKAAEEKLSMAAGVFKYAREGIIITGAEGCILDVNSAFTALTGYTHAEAVKQHYAFLESARHPPEFFREALKALGTEGVWTGEYWIPRKNRPDLPSLMTIAAVRGSTGEVKHYVTIFADISRLKRNEEELRTIAHYDALTGLPNRILLNDRLRQSLARARRHQNILAVVFLDLDGFKSVNDSYGHDAGDELLIALARRMRNTLRECDTVARIGGDEFVALLPELAQQADCKPVLDRLLAALAEPVSLGERAVRVSASLGVTFYPQTPDVDGEILLHQADRAMYQAKQEGKNQYRFFGGVPCDRRSKAQENV